jgi:hypothetical protein
VLLDRLPEWDWYDICAHLECTKCGNVGWVDPRPNWCEIINFNKTGGFRVPRAHSAVSCRGEKVKMTIWSISVCDISASLKILSLILSFVALGLSWWQQVRASIICLAVSVSMQSVIAFTPTCASIIDMRKMPVVGGPAR